MSKKKKPLVADGKGLRSNEGKNKLSLIPPEWIFGLGMVLTRGTIKYDSRNWERGMSWEKVYDSCQRHLLKFVCGERYDSELGCHHLAMAAWNILVLMTYDIRKIGDNDLVGNVKDVEGTFVEPGPELLAMMEAKKRA